MDRTDLIFHAFDWVTLHTTFTAVTARRYAEWYADNYPAGDESHRVLFWRWMQSEYDSRARGMRVFVVLVQNWYYSALNRYVVTAESPDAARARVVLNLGDKVLAVTEGE